MTEGTEALAAPLVDDEMVAAILMMLVEESEAASLLSRLDPQEVRQLGHAIYNLSDATEAHVHQALEIFVARASARSTLADGAPERLAGAMHKALGPVRAQTMIEQIAPAQRNDALAGLQWMKAADIIALLDGEHPQLVALVLAHLAPDVAGAVIQSLPDDEQDDVLFRVATLGPVTADAVAAIEDLIANAEPADDARPLPKRGGTSEAAAILNTVRKADEKRIMRALAKRDRDIARMIEQDMFTFADLMALDDRNLGTLLRSVDNALLVPSLKGADAALRDRFLACMSSRAAQTIQDEIAERGPMPLAEVTDAQRAIVAIARRLGEDGTLTLGGKGEEYV